MMTKDEFNREVDAIAGTVVIDARKDSHQYAVVVPSLKMAMDNGINRYSRGLFDEETWNSIVFHSHEVYG
jgi:hypothetical protein